MGRIESPDIAVGGFRDEAGYLYSLVTEQGG